MSRLKRTEIVTKAGRVKLGMLKPGEYEELTAEELAVLSPQTAKQVKHGRGVPRGDTRTPRGDTRTRTYGKGQGSGKAKYKDKR